MSQAIARSVFAAFVLSTVTVGCRGAESETAGSFVPNVQIAAPDVTFASDGGVNGTSASQVSIVLATATGSVPTTCADFTADEASDAGAAFDAGYFVSEIVSLYVTAGSGSDVTPGTYPISANPGTGQNVAGVSMEMASGSTVLFGASGEVTIDSVTPNYVGRFSTRIVLTDGGAVPLSGSFDAPYCVTR